MQRRKVKEYNKQVGIWILFNFINMTSDHACLRTQEAVGFKYLKKLFLNIYFIF